MRTISMVLFVLVIMTAACKKKEPAATAGSGSDVGSGSAMAGSDTAAGAGSAMAGSDTAAGAGSAMAGSATAAGSAAPAAGGARPPSITDEIVAIADKLV